MELLADDLFVDPYPIFERLRRDAPVSPVGGENAYLVASWELVAEAAARTEDFSNHFRFALHRHSDGRLGVIETGGTGPDVFAGADPPDHGAHRQIFFPKLVRDRIESLEPYVTAMTDAILDAELPRRRFDAATDLAHQVPIRVVAERVIGFADPDCDAIRRWLFEGSRVMGGLVTLDEMASLGPDTIGLVGWTDDQLDRAIRSAGRSDVADNVLGAAAAAVRSGALTHEQAAFTLMVLVGAGAETTTSLVGIAIDLLANDLDLQQRLRSNPTEVDAFVEEVLRYDAPFRYHPRTVVRDATLGGVEVPEGALVLLLWASANRDEDVFEEPDRLRIGRRNVHLHFGFGRGIHHCVGAPLARLEARVILSRLLARTSEIAPDPSRHPRFAPSIWVHRHDELPILANAG
ncbi:MAG TPA: cytochrome P450 [Acidimicrobiales bacterium]|nr:cytochrome P450 [Acidimicrobiales bacterium]